MTTIIEVPLVGLLLFQAVFDIFILYNDMINKHRFYFGCYIAYFIYIVFKTETVQSIIGESND